MSVVITVATTGPIATTADNPNLPTQPDEIARAVTSAHHLGASVAHLHFRDADERPTADLDIARRTIELIREQSDILIQVSTGVGLAVPFADRAALVELRPEMATLNPCTMSFGDGVFENPPREVDALAARMRELKIKPELEIYDTGHLDACLRLIEKGLVVPPIQVSLVLGVRGGMAATPENLVAMVNRLPDESTWQVIAIGRRNLELSAMALAMGGNVRAGMEDCLYLGKGRPVASNDELVARVVRLAEALDLEVSTLEEARASLLST